MVVVISFIDESCFIDFHQRTHPGPTHRLAYIRLTVPTISDLKQVVSTQIDIIMNIINRLFR